MTELFLKLLDKIKDPVLVAILISFLLVVFILWRLFGKQHEFIQERVEILRRENEDLQRFVRDRVEILRQENDDLRKQIQIFRDENERLRTASSNLVVAVRQIQ